MENVFPTNALPADAPAGSGAWVYVVQDNGVVCLVTSSLATAQGKLAEIMQIAVGLGPWRPVQIIQDGFFMVGPGGTTVICTRHPVTS